MFQEYLKHYSASGLGRSMHLSACSVVDRFSVSLNKLLKYSTKQIARRLWKIKIIPTVRETIGIFIFATICLCDKII